MNRIFLGSGLYGIERASISYFGKPAAEMNLGEAAMLAGIIRAPNRFSPYRHYQSALGERDMVLQRLLVEGMITAEEKKTARRKSIHVRKWLGKIKTIPIDMIARMEDNVMLSDGLYEF